jgi:hypothetical protein
MFNSVILDFLCHHKFTIAPTGFQWESLREEDHLEDPGVGGRIILKWILEKWDGIVQFGSIWLRIGTGGGLL